jgi:hypothetical protein
MSPPMRKPPEMRETVGSNGLHLEALAQHASFTRAETARQPIGVIFAMFGWRAKVPPCTSGTMR